MPHKRRNRRHKKTWRRFGNRTKLARSRYIKMIRELHFLLDLRVYFFVSSFIKMLPICYVDIKSLREKIKISMCFQQPILINTSLAEKSRLEILRKVGTLVNDGGKGWRRGNVQFGDDFISLSTIICLRHGNKCLSHPNLMV